MQLQHFQTSGTFYFFSFFKKIQISAILSYNWSVDLQILKIFNYNRVQFIAASLPVLRKDIMPWTFIKSNGLCFFLFRKFEDCWSIFPFFYTWNWSIIYSIFCLIKFRLYRNLEFRLTWEFVLTVSIIPLGKSIMKTCCWILNLFFLFIELH